MTSTGNNDAAMDTHTTSLNRQCRRRRGLRQRGQSGLAEPVVTSHRGSDEGARRCASDGSASSERDGSVPALSNNLIHSSTVLGDGWGWNCPTFAVPKPADAMSALNRECKATAGSDSEESLTSKALSRMSLRNNRPVESDSVAENISPIRPTRRRRKHKRMLVDSGPCTGTMKEYYEASELPSLEVPTTSGRLCSVDSGSNSPVSTSLPGTCPLDMNNPQLSCIHSGTEDDPSSTPVVSLRGATKRKRCLTLFPAGGGGRLVHDFASSSSGLLAAAGHQHHCSRNRHHMNRMETNPSTPSSVSDSDWETDAEEVARCLGNIDGREADDEQSDYFHESGPSYGVVPWWELASNGAFMGRFNLDSMLSNRWNGPRSRIHVNLRARIDGGVKRRCRPFKTGCRRLSEKRECQPCTSASLQAHSRSESPHTPVPIALGPPPLLRTPLFGESTIVEDGSKRQRR